MIGARNTSGVANTVTFNQENSNAGDVNNLSDRVRSLRVSKAPAEAHALLDDLHANHAGPGKAGRYTLTCDHRNGTVLGIEESHTAKRFVKQ
jgi:hypothetical protein